MGRDAYRLGRGLYMFCRGDINNNSNTNGEFMVQKAVLLAKNVHNENKFVIFDIGANIGEWSNNLLLLSRDLKNNSSFNLFLFEPAPDIASTLKNNLLNTNANICIEEIAMSNSDGFAEFYIGGLNSESNSFYPEGIADKKTKITVQQNTVNQYCESKKISHVHLLKCDTEGHDMEVILGTLPMFKNENISVLQFEYNHTWVFGKHFLRDVFSAIEFLPYKITKLQADHLLVFEEWHPELERFFEGNYAIVHNDAISWFKTKIAHFDKWGTLRISCS